MEFNRISDAPVLASSDTARFQIFKFCDHTWTLQFHVEVGADTVMHRGCAPEYKSTLENSVGLDSLSGFDQTARAQVPQINRLSKLLYVKFKSQPRAKCNRGAE